MNFNEYMDYLESEMYDYDDYYESELYDDYDKIQILRESVEDRFINDELDYEEYTMLIDRLDEREMYLEANRAEREYMKKLDKKTGNPLMHPMRRSGEALQEERRRRMNYGDDIERVYKPKEQTRLSPKDIDRVENGIRPTIRQDTQAHSNQKLMSRYVKGMHIPSYDVHKTVNANASHPGRFLDKSIEKKRQLVKDRTDRSLDKLRADRFLDKSIEQKRQLAKERKRNRDYWVNGEDPDKLY